MMNSPYPRDSLEGVLECMQHEVLNPRPFSSEYSHRDEMDGLLLRLVRIMRESYSSHPFSEGERAIINEIERTYAADRWPELRIS